MRLDPTLLAVMTAMIATGCAFVPHKALQRGDELRQRGEAQSALHTYDEVAGHPASTDAERVRAYVGGALACDALHDEVCVRLRLERAVEANIPGESEPAYFYLAERVRGDDRARALNYYYQAAAGAEKNLGRGFPYQEAMARIVELTKQ